MLARDSALGEDIKKAVSIQNENGYAVVTPSQTADFSAEQEYKIKTKDGELTVVDYASAGQSWDPDLPMTVWIKTDET